MRGRRSSLTIWLKAGITLDSGTLCRQNVPMSDKPRRPINVRRADVMQQVQGEVGEYQSALVDSIRAHGNVLDLPNMQIRLAAEFGFCDGVRRAIEIAHATCRVFAGKRIWLIGEIIHNPDVNRRLDSMGLRRLPWRLDAPEYAGLTPEDVVIIPAFGVSVTMRRFLDEKGVQLVDTTCGNVVKVWHRVRHYASRGITSIIHGKYKHEESLATASHSLGDDGTGHFLVIFSKEDARIVADYIAGRGEKAAFMERFGVCCSEGFDPDVHLCEIGMANQTTMLKNETAVIQRMLREAVVERDGSPDRFHAFDTICGATQDRQNALYALLEEVPDVMFIVGGYNSSNTTHLAQIASEKVPTYFVRDAECLLDAKHVRAFRLRTKEEMVLPLPAVASDGNRFWRVGITAGASCPANVIERVIRRLAELRGCPLS